MRCQRARLSLQPEEKQKAAQQFSKLQTAMKVLGISPDEQKACWLILAAIYHLGAAGATKGNVQWVPTAQLIAPESLWRPCRSVRPHPAQTSLLADTPLLFVPLPSPPPQRRLRAPGEASLPRPWTAVMPRTVKSRGAVVRRLRGKKKV